MRDFDQAFERIVGVEGGYVNDPHDPGGETKYGISKRAYPNVDIANLTIEQAKVIYRKNYWDRCQCDRIPWPMSLFVFDGAVNQGVTATIRTLQRTLSVPVDGTLGPVTLQRAIQSDAEHAALFMAERAMTYMDSSQFHAYGRGWLKRMFVIAGDAA